MMNARMLIWVFSALLALPGVVAAQGLADAARAAEEQRRAVGEADEGRVFTNGTLRPEAPPAVPARIPPVSFAAAGGEADAEGEDAEAGDEGEEGADDEVAGADQGEDYWRGRITAARAEVSRSQTLLAALQSRVNALNADFVNTDDPIQRQAVFDQRETALAELAAMQQAIEDNQQAIADIQEEARRAGVPAGWVR